MIENIRDLQLKLVDMLKDFDSFCKENEIKYFLAYGTVLGAVRHKGFIPWDDDLDIYMLREDYEKLLNIYTNNDHYFLQKEVVDYPLHFSKLRDSKTTFIEDIPYKKNYKKINQGVFIDIFPLDVISKNRVIAFFQVLFSNILITQSLFLRGYPDSHNSFLKKILLLISTILIPFKKVFKKFICKFNKENGTSLCSFFGEIRPKIILNAVDFTNSKNYLPFEDSEFPVMNNYKEYLERFYGDYMKFPSEEEIEYKIHAKIVDLDKSYIYYL